MRINLFLNKKDLRNSDLFPAIMDYFRRIDKFVKINIYYCLNSKLFDQSDSYNINVSIDGEYMDSIEFSNIIIFKSMDRIKNINIVFGTSNLYHNICFVCFNVDIDLLFLIVLEQIYRSYKIINNEPYHK